MKNLENRLSDEAWINFKLALLQSSKPKIEPRSSKKLRRSRRNEQLRQNAKVVKAMEETALDIEIESGGTSELN